MKRALIFSGGWEGHYPAAIETFAIEKLLNDFDVVRTDRLSYLEDVDLRAFDLLVPNWTLGHLSIGEESSLLRAVESGVGLVAWHGVGDAFNGNHLFKFMLGGQFICHPGDFVPYRVEFLDSGAPLTQGLAAFELTSEQYYMHVDPANTILATTKFSGARYSWIKDCVVPVAWTRSWGAGRVFYHSIGHTVSELSIPQVLELTRRGIAWACRTSPHPSITPVLLANSPR